MTKCLIAIAGLLLGFLGARLVPPGDEQLASTPIVSEVKTLVPAERRKAIHSFRELIVAQRGQATLPATKALFQRIQSTQSPAVLRAMEEELSLAEDPALGILAEAIRSHLQEAHPDSAAALQESAGSTWSDIERRQRALTEWAKQDPEAAFTFAQRDPIINHRPLMLEAALLGAAHTDPNVAYRLWSSLTAPDLKHRLSRNLAWAMAEAMPERFEEWQNAFPTEHETIHQMAFRVWATKSPETALSALAEFEGKGNSSDKAALGLLEGWGSQDPESAAAWAEARDLGLPIQALREWATKDPEAALNHAIQQPGNQALPVIAIEWMRQDPESTLPWVLENLNDADQLAVIKDSLNEDAPQGTDFEMASWLIQHPHPHAKSATESFLRRLQDREAAIEWVASLETIHQRRFMPAVFADWMKQSPVEAEKYLNSLSSPRAEARLINHTERLMWSDEDKKAFKDWALPRLSQEARQLFP